MLRRWRIVTVCFIIFFLQFFHVVGSIEFLNKRCSSPTSVIIFSPNAPANEAAFVIPVYRQQCLNFQRPFASTNYLKFSFFSKNDSLMEFIANWYKVNLNYGRLQISYRGGLHTWFDKILRNLSCFSLHMHVFSLWLISLSFKILFAPCHGHRKIIIILDGLPCLPYKKKNHIGIFGQCYRNKFWNRIFIR